MAQITVFDMVKELDGKGSGLDADTLQGLTPDEIGTKLGDTFTTPSRSLGTTYTNTSDKYIIVLVGVLTNEDSYGYVYINGTAVGRMGSGGGGIYYSLCYVVPPGFTYKVTASSKQYWHEIV